MRRLLLLLATALIAGLLMGCRPPASTGETNGEETARPGESEEQREVRELQERGKAERDSRIAQADPKERFLNVTRMLEETIRIEVDKVVPKRLPASSTPKQVSDELRTYFSVARVKIRQAFARFQSDKTPDEYRPIAEAKQKQTTAMLAELKRAGDIAPSMSVPELQRLATSLKERRAELQKVSESALARAGLTPEKYAELTKNWLDKGF